MGKAAAALLLLAGLAGTACRGRDGTAPGEDTATATPPVLLSTDSPTKDEDPSVLLARDGSLYIAWFSDRGNNNDIYVRRSLIRGTWSDPVRVTTGPAGDFYPNLIQDTQGTLHLVWFQWVALRVGQIRHASSSNGLVWAPEDAVTTQFLVDDWVPTIAEAADASLVVCFVSEKRSGIGGTADIYMARRGRGAAAWEAPIRLSVNSASEHDQLPYLARTGSQLGMVWVRHDTRTADFIAHPKSDLYYASSVDGLTWSAPVRVTTHAGNVVNLFPQIFGKHDGSWSILWLSTRTGVPRQYEIPLARLSDYPAASVENGLLPAGYSHRVTATATRDEYLAAWVQGAVGSEDVYYRYLRR